MKTLMPIRGQLSIMASIMCLCHNIFFGRTYFITRPCFSTKPDAMSAVQLAAGVISIILIAIMLPLSYHVFSGYTEKDESSKGNGERSQRLAYVYYGLLYVHIMVLMIPAQSMDMWNMQ